MPQGDWLYDNSANKFNNTYFRDYNNTGFAVDMSGDLVVRGTIRNDDTGAVDMSGDLIVRNGNVGIGTTDPTYDLEVSRGTESVGVAIEGRFPSFVINYRDGGTYPDGDLRMFVNNQVQFYIQLKATAEASWYTKMILHNDSSTPVNDFTGQHRAFVENVSHTDASYNQGLIVCANKNSFVNISNVCKGNQAITQNESLPVVSLSTKSKDKSCFGVISESEDPESRSERIASAIFPIEKEVGDTRIYINSVGEGAIWVSNKNGSLESGDYITTSDIPGYGEKQEDDILHNYTVAKITMDCDFNPQLQPKEIILKEAVVDDSGNTVYKNVLDANGEIQWTPELDSDGNVVQEYAYNLRYLDLQGARLTKAEYDTKLANGEQVHIAAYVGCTYHCG